MARTTRNRSPLIVGFPLYSNVTLVDFAGATQVFAFAGGAFQPIWLAKELNRVETSERVHVWPNYTFADHPQIDILFVPGGGALGPKGECDGGVIGAMFDPDFQKFVRATARKAQWVGSVCVGAFILAAARLLDGVRATAYWSQLPNLKLLGDRFGFSVDTNNYPRWEIDSEKHRFTGGGVSSSIDLALELVNILKGPRASKMAQLSIQYAPHPPLHSGDPSTAPTAVVRAVGASQQKGFIKPMRAAVMRLLRESPTAQR